MVQTIIQIQGTDLANMMWNNSYNIDLYQAAKHLYMANLLLVFSFIHKFLATLDLTIAYKTTY